MRFYEIERYGYTNLGGVEVENVFHLLLLLIYGVWKAGYLFFAIILQFYPFHVVYRKYLIGIPMLIP